MDWSKGYSASYHATLVDRDSWRDIGKINLLDGSIQHTDSGLRESASLTFVNYSNVGEPLIRIWLDAQQGSDSSHIPLFTGYAISPNRNIKGRLVSTPVQCYSVLKPAQDVLLPRGWYAPKDMNGAEAIKDLLKVTKAPVRIADNSPTLKQAIIAEGNESNLSMIEKLLDAITWRLRILGDGTIEVIPYATEIVDSFDSQNNDILEQSLSITYDWYAVPNVFRAVVDDISAVARDDDPSSPFSTVNRGREVWLEETNCYLNDGESASAYANRRLKELQRVSTSISYDRRFKPNVLLSDLVRINYPSVGISGHFLITSQTIALGPNATTSEEVFMI